MISPLVAPIVVPINFKMPSTEGACKSTLLCFRLQDLVAEHRETKLGLSGKILSTGEHSNATPSAILSSNSTPPEPDYDNTEANPSRQRERERAIDKTA